jgi:hypothetical protein
VRGKMNETLYWMMSVLSADGGLMSVAVACSTTDRNKCLCVWHV